MILHEVKTYIAVCGWCRSKSEPFTSRLGWGDAVPDGWAIARMSWREDYGLISDSEYVCPDCMVEARKDNWTVE